MPRVPFSRYHISSCLSRVVAKRKRLRSSVWSSFHVSLRWPYFILSKIPPDLEAAMDDVPGVPFESDGDYGWYSVFCQFNPFSQDHILSCLSHVVAKIIALKIFFMIHHVSPCKLSTRQLVNSSEKVLFRLPVLVFVYFWFGRFTTFVLFKLGP